MAYFFSLIVSCRNLLPSFPLHALVPFISSRIQLWSGVVAVLTMRIRLGTNQLKNKGTTAWDLYLVEILTVNEEFLRTSFNLKYLLMP